jgi:hypothetical protein
MSDHNSNKPVTFQEKLEKKYLGIGAGNSTSGFSRWYR